MTDTIQHIDTIFRLLKEQMIPYGTPIVSRKKQDIPETPFVTLISCLLSLRTKDEVTAGASRRLLTKYHTPQKIVQLSQNQIETMIYPVGFYKTKAKRIKDISRILLEKHQGNVPDSMEGLLSLKGVGRKTANIVMVYGHKKHGYLPIDTHCHRIPNRLGWIRTKTPEETERALIKILPQKYWDDFNDLFVRFGQTICVPVSPFCSRCSLQKYCKKIGVLASR